MYHLLALLVLLESAAGDGNFRFTNTQVEVSEVPFTQASFGISRTGATTETVLVTCQVGFRTEVKVLFIKKPIVTCSSTISDFISVCSTVCVHCTVCIGDVIDFVRCACHWDINSCPFFCLHPCYGRYFSVSPNWTLLES